MSQSELQGFFALWLAKNGAANVAIKKAKGSLKAAVRGGVVICNTATKTLSLQYEELVNNGTKCYYRSAIKPLGHLPVGQSAY
jgi:hypothetical protein